MADEGVPTTHAGVVTWSVDDPIVAAVRQVLAAMPSGCGWLLPVTQDGEGRRLPRGRHQRTGPRRLRPGAGRVGGLLVWWERLDEHQRRMERTELLGSLGWAEYD